MMMLINKTIIKRLGVIAAFFMLFTSCLTYEDIDFKGIDDVKVNEFSQKGIDVEIMANIYNPNNYNIKIVDSDLDFYLGNTKVGRGTIDKNITIKKKLEKSYTFRLKADPGQMQMGITNILQMLFTQTATVGVKGTIKVRAMGVSKTIPVDFKEKIAL